VAYHRGRIYDHRYDDELHPPCVAQQSEELLDDHHHGTADRDPLLADQMLDDHDLRSDDHDPRPDDHDLRSDVLFPHLGGHDLQWGDRMPADLDWTSAHQNFLGAMVDRCRLLGAMDDRCRLLGVTDDHLRYEDEVPRHRRDVGVQVYRQTCVGGQRHQPMDDLGDLQTCAGELLGPPLSADAMGAHHRGEDAKDGCRPGVGHLLR
jgi:hypothetical protein